MVEGTGTCLDKLGSILDIKIPNGVEAFLFLVASEDILNGDAFVDTDDDSWGVEDEEHDNCRDEDQGIIGICLLMIQSYFHMVSGKPWT